MKRILEFLQARFDFGLWMFTRVDEDDWRVLSANDRGYGVKEGDLFRWTHSYCKRMVEGLGPRVAPDSTQVAVYAEAEIGQMIPIKAYVGVPIYLAGGTLFGTLCAVDPAPQSESLLKDAEELNMMGLMISSMVEAELRAEAANRQAELAMLEAHRDSLTGLKNRSAWVKCLDSEEDRAQCFASPVGLLILDLDDLKSRNDTRGHQAGDELIARFGRLLDREVAEWGVAFRIGGDEFGCILPGCGPAAMLELVSRIRALMHSHGIQVSIGASQRDYVGGLQAAWEAADRAMYADKATRGLQRSA